MYCSSQEVEVYEEQASSSGVTSPCVSRSQIDEAKAYCRSDRVRQLEGEWIITANRFEKRNLKKRGGRVGGEPLDFMRDARRVLQKQVQLVSGPKHVTFRTKDVGGMKRSWRGIQ